ncbi:MAG TPA: amino acid adenylation domain-containing protein, partial [Pyrinomonadaceae bacterium]
FELFVTLSLGGAVLLAADALELASAPWAAGRVTLVNTVPSALSALLGLGAVPEGVEVVALAGEPLPAELVRRAYGAGAGAVYNLYGPTEDTTYSTWALVGEGDGLPPAIGLPVGGTSAYVVDGAGEPAAWGARGELLLSGAGLARGYLGRPSLTAERFVPEAGAGTPGARAYRTGDVCRVRAGGELEYLGRGDQQVKVRGFRIELGEIEAALRGHEGVGQAAVKAWGEGEHRRLAAYVTPREGCSVPAAAGLREHLRGRLPEYMVPAAFIFLEGLPLTPNGKVDRKALKEPGWGDVVAAASATGGGAGVWRTPVEEMVAGVWAEVLGAEVRGAAENFFELGGHSLLATRVVSRLRQVFGVEVPLRDFFAAPTVAALAAHVESARGEGARVSRIGRAQREGRLALSSAQQRLWFLEQLEPGGAAYNVPGAVRLSGALNRAALEQSLGEVVRRHEALRTRFAAAPGTPEQIVEASARPAWEYADLRAMPEGRKEAESGRVGRAEARRPFDLERAPLLRVTLIQLADSEHVLLLTLHHIVSDGWSMGVLVSEVSALYAAYSSGAPSPLAELPIQYADYAAWQREWLEGENLERQLAYWRENLAGAPPALALPYDRRRPSVPSYRGESLAVRIDAELTGALKRLSRQEGATLFMTLLAAFQALLHRYTGQDDISVGSPVANRRWVELEPLVGFFVNTLVMRAKVEGGESFRELVRRVRETTLGAYAHQDVPFERLVEELQPGRSLNTTPLFQVMFVMQNAWAHELKIGGLAVEALEPASASAKFDLTLELRESGDGLAGTLRYSTDLFERETAARLLTHFQRLLAAACAEPAEPLSRLPLSTHEELRLLEAPATPERPEHSAQSLQQLFEAQARRAPDAVALVGRDSHVTYAALERRADSLARRLRRLGVGPEQRVGVHLGRGVELVVALLGVLKAGGAYVPLDPAYPAERLRLMLEDSGASVVVTRSESAAALPAGVAHVVLLDDEEPDAPAVRPARTRPQHPAYVIYTSGSTGRPKGVVVEHRSVLNLCAALEGAVYSAHEDCRLVGVNASFAFDASVKQFVQLCMGRALYVVPEEVRGDGAALLAHLERHRVEVLDCTPSQLSLLRAAGMGRGARAATRVVLVGGEAIDEETWRGLSESDSVAFYNVYGPTECTVDTTVCRIRRGLERPTIGRPVANARVRLLDGGGRPVPPGVVGEVYIGGEPLARGYLNRPALTADRFIPDPFAARPSARLYRSGDLARYLPDGRLEFLGRADQQVKVRGYRIELGEIEAALRGHEAVREAVVSARDDAGRGARIVAYVVPAEGQTPAAEELRRALRERLPEYMVPSAFVLLDRLPLTPSGKVDRRALPEPEGDEAAGEFVQPRTAVEEIVAGVLAGVLKVERVGVDDNFFDLGGHSLLATQVTSRLGEAFSVDVPLRKLFESPTAAGLAEAVEAALREGHAAPPPRVERAARTARTPLSFAQQRLWFLDQLEPHNPAYHISAALRLEGALNVHAFEQALGEVVRRHEALRSSFVFVEDGPVQVVATAAPLTLPLVSLKVASGAEADRLGAAHARRGFDLGRAPLLRVTLLRRGPEEHVLLLTMHHIVSDGWSVGVLVREVSALYEAYSEGAPSPLPEPEVQYADYAAWQRRRLEGATLERQLSYWREKLAGAPEALDLPTDRPRPPVQSYRGATERFALPADLSRELRRLSRGEGVTLFMTLLAAFEVLLSRYSGQTDFCVGTPVAGRTRPEVEGLVGFFVNTLVMRGDLSGDPSFSQLLARTRETALEAFMHQDVPFERLVEELRPGRSLNTTPLFQVMFVMQNNEAAELGLGRLDTRLQEIDSGTEKFDLTLELRESDNGLAGALRYSTDLFEPGTAARLLSHFRQLLSAACADPSLPLSRLPLSPPEELRRLTAPAPLDWPADWPPRPAACLHHLFEAQARRAPDAVALAR